MRVYHLLRTKWGLSNLVHQRLKVAEFADMNDPFELLSVELSNRAMRRTFLAWKNKAMREKGVLCFSRDWSSPVLWSHYADKHKGMCLGFDVPDKLLKEIVYTKGRSILGDGFLKKGLPASDHVERFFVTKYEHWQYEEEVRLILRLNETIKEDGHYFKQFDEDLVLKEIILGARWPVGKARVQSVLGKLSGSVTITKARLAFKSFSVVPDKRGFRGSRRCLTAH